MRVVLVLAIGLCLGGCAAVALPFRATADVARLVPVVGGVVAAPFDVVGDVID